MASASTCELSIDGGPAVAVAAGTRLLDAADAMGVAIEAACGGFACCSSCRVVVTAGALSPLLPEEGPFLDAPDQRLACQAHLVSGRVCVTRAPGC